MEYLLEAHPGHTLLVTLAIGIVIGMGITLWLDHQYRLEQKERNEKNEMQSEELLSKWRRNQGHEQGCASRRNAKAIDTNLLQAKRKSAHCE